MLSFVSELHCRNFLSFWSLRKPVGASTDFLLLPIEEPGWEEKSEVIRNTFQIEPGRLGEEKKLLR